MILFQRKQVGSKQSQPFPPLLSNFWKENATCTQYALGLDNAIFGGKCPSTQAHRNLRQMDWSCKQRANIHMQGPCLSTEMWCKPYTISWLNFRQLLMKQKVLLLTSVTSMTLMAASWPVLTWRPWVRKRENSQHQHLTHPSSLHRAKHLDKSSTHWVFPSNDTSLLILPRKYH